MVSFCLSLISSVNYILYSAVKDFIFSSALLDATTIYFPHRSTIKVTGVQSVLETHYYFCLSIRGATEIYNKGERDLIDLKLCTESSLVTHPV